jgi:sedoheptulokinase
MHGIVLLDRDLAPVSNLVTWQDQRCIEDAAFLPRLNQATGHCLRTGFGNATLAWLVSRGEVPANAACVATIQDLLAAQLCGLDRPVTDTTDGQSLGLFDLTRLDWDRDAVKAAGIGAGMLPDVVACGAEAGRVSSKASARLGIPEGIPVCAAIGDNQASLFATIEDPRADIALTLGTGGQLSAVLDSLPGCRASAPGLEIRPYAERRYIAAAISLAGGGAWKQLAEFLFARQEAFGLHEDSVQGVYDRMNEAGRSGSTRSRIRADALSAIRLGPGGMSLADLSGGVAREIIGGLSDAFPPELLPGRKRIVASGNALRRNPLIVEVAQTLFGLPVVVPGLREEAACGAAMLAARGHSTQAKGAEAITA